LPAGATIECPAYAINYDNEIFPNAAEFDPLRFYKLRQKVSENGVVGSKATEASAQNQFVSVSQNSLTFGYGRHACPGRFFAANEIKMIVANTVLQYDIKMADGSKGRYPNVEFAHMVSLFVECESQTRVLSRPTVYS
jgi:cytochrome P450